MLGIPVRIGTQVELSGLADSLNTPPYATCIGLIRWGARHGAAPLNTPTSGQSGERGGWGPTYDRFKDWLREFLP
jgi:cell division protein FtsA